MQRDRNCFWITKAQPDVVVTAECRTSALNDDLGQIDYVFSDKTGTLTENEMIFRLCSAGGKSFGKSSLLQEAHGLSLIHI